MNGLLLAVEGGGSRTRVWLAGKDGRILARETCGPSSILYIEPRNYGRELRKTLERIRSAAAGVRVAAAGLGGPMEPALVEQAIAEVFGKVRIVRTGECDIALALYGLEWGLALVAGTGASCRAVDRNGRAVSCGGFGPQFGDEGSGYWIGRSAITAVMLARDGRGPRTALEERALTFFRAKDIGEIFRMTDHSGHLSGTRVASFAPHVFDTARGGDRVAVAICSDAGRALGNLVVATAARLDWGGTPVPLVMTGGVFHAGGLVTRSLYKTLHKPWLRIEVLPPVAEPTEGIFKVLQKKARARKTAGSGPSGKQEAADEI